MTTRMTTAWDKTLKASPHIDKQADAALVNLGWKIVGALDDAQATLPEPAYIKMLNDLSPKLVSICKALGVGPVARAEANKPTQQPKERSEEEELEDELAKLRNRGA